MCVFSRASPGDGLNSESGNRADDIEETQQVENDHDHDQAIDDGLDTGRHGDEAVDKPKQDADHDKDKDGVDERGLQADHEAFFSQIMDGIAFA